MLDGRPPRPSGRPAVAVAAERASRKGNGRRGILILALTRTVHPFGGHQPGGQ